MCFVQKGKSTAVSGNAFLTAIFMISYQYPLLQAQPSHTGGGDEGFVGKYHQLGIWFCARTTGTYSRCSIL